MKKKTRFEIEVQEIKKNLEVDNQKHINVHIYIHKNEKLLADFIRCIDVDFMYEPAQELPIQELAFSSVGNISIDVLDILGSKNDIYVRAVSKLMHWDGSIWTTVDSVYNNDVMKIKQHESDIYIASYYNGTGYISKYDGKTWTVICSGFDRFTVTDIAFIGNEMYVSGAFTSIGGVKMNRIACWDGIAWNSLGAGLDGDVFVMCAYGTDLYVGGSFNSADGMPANKKLQTCKR